MVKRIPSTTCPPNLRVLDGWPSFKKRDAIAIDFPNGTTNDIDTGLLRD
jgi:hypothetical protein